MGNERVYLSVDNDGKGVLRIVAIYINDELVTEPDLDYTIEERYFRPIYIPYDWKSGVTYNFVIESEHGNKYACTRVTPETPDGY